MMAQKPLATTAVSCKVVDFRSIRQAPDGLNGKKFCDLMCCKASVVVARVVATASRNRLVLRGQLYNTDHKYKGTVAVNKNFMFRFRCTIVLAFDRS